MDFEAIHDSLIAQGYAADTADAKIAHDVILEAIKAADFRANLTVKGGVVMSGLTNMVRRATMDMDVRTVRIGCIVMDRDRISAFGVARPQTDRAVRIARRGAMRSDAP